MGRNPGITKQSIENKILLVRGKKIILDSDLALLYRVDVKRLNEQVKRNKQRFPADFLFRLTPEESEILRSHFATSSGRHGGRRYAPLAFTEHGAIMAATVLNSSRAVEMSVFVVRAFVRLRELLNRNRELSARFTELETRLDAHDESIRQIITAIKELMAPRVKPSRHIGFCLSDRTAIRAKRRELPALTS
jgi:hypothetical protein